MADEAFALSPIAARPAGPTEADYGAILEAFMETSRGRWFLNEYANRNRSTDTRMVLEALNRLEDKIASDKNATLARIAAAPPPSPAPDRRLLATAMAAAIAEAREKALKMLAATADNAAAETIRTASGRLGEVSAALRACGADTRICDLMDNETDKIAAAGARQAEAPDRAHTAMAAAFDALAARLAVLIDETAAPTPPTAAADTDLAAPSPQATTTSATQTPPATASNVTPLRPLADAADGAASMTAATTVTADAPDDGAARTNAAPAPAVADAVAQPDIDRDDLSFDAPAAVMPAPAKPMAAPAAQISADTFVRELAAAAAAGPESALVEAIDLDAVDLAALDLDVAPAEASPPLSASNLPDARELAELDLAEVDLGDMVFSAHPAPPAAPPPAAAPISSPAVIAAKPIVAETIIKATASTPRPRGAEQSLGAAILERGMAGPVERPKPDPYAAIRRMTMAERIALFS